MRQLTNQAPTIFRHSASKKLKLATHALMATLDEVQPHQMSLESSVVLESPRARMLSQYLYGTETQDSANIGHEVLYRTEVARCNAYRLLSTASQPASLWHRGFSSDSGYHIRRHSSPPSPWPEVWCNMQGTMEDADHSLVLGLSRTGIQISRASHANAFIQFSTWLTMVPQTKSWYWLGSIDSLRSPSASGAEVWHR